MEFSKQLQEGIYLLQIVPRGAFKRADSATDSARLVASVFEGGISSPSTCK